ncbi:MAG TPA: hypothetical protein PLM56_06370 [Cyclobacteriaceae bacterium]|jgi:predicted nucleic acid-binding Zn ribbon protein|nr:hypothetical protein [Cytophagales bacterium]HRE67289.1 hypothetical protein [Cyclobacteriaceae bacterium]HRF33103.1 hypothetical protein [Cyclobacteriaceae bacterium]
MTKKEEKVCLECGGKITGRSDKKFCSDQCRVAYNNKLNRDETAYMNNVTNILRKNRRVLMELNLTGKTKVNRDKLNDKGFDFNYFTSQYKTKDGSVYNFCYEQGYLPLENNWYLLVVKGESPKSQPQ